MIELISTGGFVGGKLYSVVVNGNRYDITTGSTNTIDYVGEVFCQLHQFDRSYSERFL